MKKNDQLIRALTDLIVLPLSALFVVAGLIRVLDTDISRALFETLVIISLFLPVIALGRGLAKTFHFGVILASCLSALFWILVANGISLSEQNRDLRPTLVNNIITFIMFAIVSSLVLAIYGRMMEKLHKKLKRTV